MVHGEIEYTIKVPSDTVAKVRSTTHQQPQSQEKIALKEAKSEPNFSNNSKAKETRQTIS